MLPGPRVSVSGDLRLPWLASGAPARGPWRIEDTMGPSWPVGALPSYEGWKTIATSGRMHVHLYSYAGTEGGEPIFRRNGGSAARTAREWLLEGRARTGAGLHFFDTTDGSAPSPENLTPPVYLRGRGSWPMRGFLYFNARKVVLRASSGTAAPTAVRPPGEPFLDAGLDLDGDGRICNMGSSDSCCPAAPVTPAERTRCNEARTVGNGVWDVEMDLDCDARREVCDSDGARPLEPVQHTLFASSHAPAPGALPHEGTDPRFLRPFAHEPFLNLDYPADWRDPARLDWDAAREGTTTGRDRRGPEREVSLHLYGILFAEGEVVLHGRIHACGAILAGGGIEVLGRPVVLHDSGLLLNRWPPYSSGMREAGDSGGIPRMFEVR